MSTVSAEYYQIKGMVSDMPAEEQAEVVRVESLVVELANTSQSAALGVMLASIKLSLEA
ncbi:hypothetical protein SAMN05216475_6299 [Pseudomonas synxantha]|uniref:Uncharacterized protein n=1 Tax=Pseudomonas synxantha TaxID=47883 RepID=A0AAX3I0M1_9PSED|nr:hypothetical protein [Pseudomonas synxantha]SDU69059.1 hypothetical protein SAMN05216475_6299 [Pseudomonas synxantha]VTQ88126.1 Uncharacterised protein [Pseudomonas synxantha]